MANRSVAVNLESNMRSIKEMMNRMLKQMDRMIMDAEKKRGRDESSRNMAIEGSKSEIPSFNGDNPDAWILQAENYFALKGLNNEEQLEISASLFEGVALRWFQWENHRRPFRRWEDLKLIILRQFRSITGCYSGKSFQTLKQGLAMERDNSQGKKVENIERGKDGEDTPERDRHRGRVGFVDRYLDPLLPSTPPVSLPSPSPPSSPPSLHSPSSHMPPPPQHDPPLNRTKAETEKSIVILMENKETDKFFWPKPKRVGLSWPNPIRDFIGSMISTSNSIMSTRNRSWLSDDLRIRPPLPPPLLMPLPWPPPVFLPPPLLPPLPRPLPQPPEVIIQLNPKAENMTEEGENGRMPRILQRDTTDKLALKLLQVSVLDLTNGTVGPRKEDFRGILISELSNGSSLKLVCCVDLLSRLSFLQSSLIVDSISEVSFSNGHMIADKGNVCSGLYTIWKVQMRILVELYIRSQNASSLRADIHKLDDDMKLSEKGLFPVAVGWEYALTGQPLQFLYFFLGTKVYARMKLIATDPRYSIAEVCRFLFFFFPP